MIKYKLSDLGKEALQVIKEEKAQILSMKTWIVKEVGDFSVTEEFLENKLSSIPGGRASRVEFQASLSTLVDEGYLEEID